MGQVGSAFGNSNTFAPDPSDLSGSEWTARLLGGAGKGALQGFGSMQQQNQQLRQGGGGASPVAPVQPSNVQFASTNFTPGTAADGPGTGNPNSLPNSKAKNPFFYGYGQGS